MDNYGIKPVLDIHNMWKDPDATRQLAGYENVVYNYKGNVYCYCLGTGEKREMAVYPQFNKRNTDERRVFSKKHTRY